MIFAPELRMAAMRIEPHRTTSCLSLLASLALGCGARDVPGPRPAGPAPTVRAADLAAPFSLAVAFDGTTYVTSDGDGSILRFRPQEAAPTVIVDQQEHPRDATLDDDGLFWTTAGADGGAGGQVRRMADALKDDPGHAMDLAPSERAPAGIALDATCVFWTARNDDGTKTLLSVWKEGAIVAPVASDVRGLADVVASLSGIFWSNSDDGTVSRVRQLGDPVVVLATAVAPTRLALHEDLVYWIDGGAIERTSIDGGEPEEIAPPGTATDLVVDATTVHWVSESTGEVGRIDLATRASTVLATGQVSPVDIAVDERTVRWITRGSGPRDGALLELPR